VPRNASWNAEELIIALDLYFRAPPTKSSQNDPRIVEAARLLRRLSGHQRTAASVYMKMRNFLRFDASSKSKGLARGARLEWAIWKGFHDDRALLRRTAKKIAARVNALRQPQESLRL